MGMYDSVHAGNRCGQVKAFGKRLAVFRTGDTVVLRPSPMTAEAYETALESGMWPESDTRDYQVLMMAGWLQVRDARIVEWVDDPVPGVPCVNYFGHPTEPCDNLGEVDGFPIRGHEDSRSQSLAIAFGLPTLDDLDPADPEWDERVAYLQAEWDERRDIALCLPGPCGVCARLRGEEPAPQD